MTFAGTREARISMPFFAQAYETEAGEITWENASSQCESNSKHTNTEAKTDVENKHHN